jgi:hypothetical protein
VVAKIVAKTVWLHQLLTKLHRPIHQATIVYCDNISAVYMSGNPVQHRGTKYIEIDIHFVWEKVALGQVHVLHVPTIAQFNDIFTKALPSSVFSNIFSVSTLLTPPLILRGVVRLYLMLQVRVSRSLYYRNTCTPYQIICEDIKTL